MTITYSRKRKRNLEPLHRHPSRKKPRLDVSFGGEMSSFQTPHPTLLAQSQVFKIPSTKPRPSSTPLSPVPTSKTLKENISHSKTLVSSLRKVKNHKLGPKSKGHSRSSSSASSISSSSRPSSRNKHREIDNPKKKPRKPKKATARLFPHAAPFFSTLPESLTLASPFVSRASSPVDPDEPIPLKQPKKSKRGLRDTFFDPNIPHIQGLRCQSSPDGLRPSPGAEKNHPNKRKKNSSPKEWTSQSMPTSPKKLDSEAKPRKPLVDAYVYRLKKKEMGTHPNPIPGMNSSTTSNSRERRPSAPSVLRVYRPMPNPAKRTSTDAAPSNPWNPSESEYQFKDNKVDQTLDPGLMPPPPISSAARSSRFTQARSRRGTNGRDMDVGSDTDNNINPTWKPARALGYAGVDFDRPPSQLDLIPGGGDIGIGEVDLDAGFGFGFGHGWSDIPVWDESGDEGDSETGRRRSTLFQGEGLFKPDFAQQKEGQTDPLRLGLRALSTPSTPSPPHISAGVDDVEFEFGRSVRGISTPFDGMGIEERAARGTKRLGKIDAEKGKERGVFRTRSLPVLGAGSSRSAEGGWIDYAPQQRSDAHSEREAEEEEGEEDMQLTDPVGVVPRSPRSLPEYHHRQVQSQDHGQGGGDEEHLSSWITDSIISPPTRYLAKRKKALDQNWDAALSSGRGGGGSGPAPSPHQDEVEKEDAEEDGYTVEPAEQLDVLSSPFKFGDPISSSPGLYDDDEVTQAPVPNVGITKTKVGTTDPPWTRRTRSGTVVMGSLPPSLPVGTRRTRSGTLLAAAGTGTGPTTDGTLGKGTGGGGSGLKTMKRTRGGTVVLALPPIPSGTGTRAAVKRNDISCVDEGGSDIEAEVEIGVGDGFADAHPDGDDEREEDRTFVQDDRTQRSIRWGDADDGTDFEPYRDALYVPGDSGSEDELDFWSAVKLAPLAWSVAEEPPSPSRGGGGEEGGDTDGGNVEVRGTGRDRGRVLGKGRATRAARARGRGKPKPSKKAVAFAVGGARAVVKARGQGRVRGRGRGGTTSRGWGRGAINSASSSSSRGGLTSILTNAHTSRYTRTGKISTLESDDELLLKDGDCAGRVFE